VAVRRVDVAVRRADVAVRRADVAVNNGRVTSAKLSKVSISAYALCLHKLTHCAVLLL
jgi:lactam utilization protein B